MQPEPTVPSPAPPPLPEANPFQPPGAVGFPLGATVTDEDRSLGMLCHLLGVFTGFLGPLILWLVKKDSSRFIDHHGRESLNFQITLLLLMLALASVTFVLMFVLVGVLLFPLFIVVPILAMIAEIIAAVAAQKGDWHRYPFCLRLV